MLTFKKGYGYWDVTKYPYGGDFKRFDGTEIGHEIAGPVKNQHQARVQLSDGRVIVADRDSIDE